MTGAVALPRSDAAAPGWRAAEPAGLAPLRSALADPDFANAWDALADQASTPNPFFERWYLEPSLQNFAADGRVALLTTHAGGVLTGLMPVVRAPRYSRWPIPHLAGWLHPNCFLGAPLVRTGCEAAFWRAALAAFDRSPGTAIFLHLAGLPLDTPLTAALFEVCREQHRSAATVHREERALLASELSPDDYHAAALPGKKRKELRRQRNRLAETGALTIERLRDETAIGGWIDEFLALEAAGWKGRAGSALAAHPATEALIRAALPAAAARGKLERLALRLDGRAIAMLATFLSAPGAFSFKTAYDETLARFSPGVMLQTEALALLDRREIEWTDSCAAADHPMIDSLWMERRTIGRVSVAIGGPARRALFAGLLAAERRRGRIAG